MRKKVKDLSSRYLDFSLKYSTYNDKIQNIQNKQLENFKNLTDFYERYSIPEKVKK